jgi:ABC-type multidrug transport system fused ATPase/permease subunit
MYTFSSKLKVFSIVLIIVGLLGIGYSFISAPKTTADVEKILEAEAHGHHGSHDAHAHDTHAHGANDAAAHAEHEEHLNHVLHQLQNKPWAAFYVAALFFMLISLGVLAFYAIQNVAQAGWSPVLFRVMQGITAYLPVGSLIFFYYWFYQLSISIIYLFGWILN